MDILKQDDLRQIVETSGEYCVSIYQPTHKTGREQQQDPIRLKNLISDAEEKLVKYGVRMPQIQKLLRPANDLLDDKKFWQHQSEGLAIFLSKEFTRIYRLPSRFDELVVISKNFHIKPVLPLLVNEDRQFYILAISLNQIRLFLGTQYMVNELELPDDMPTSMEEALFMDHPEKNLGFHTGTGKTGGSGSRPAIFHGQGKQADDNEKNILRYFQYVNKGLRPLLKDNIPLVLAGAEYLLPIYHDSNPFAELLKEGVEGNPDELDEKELHRRAWNIVKSIFDKDLFESIAQFKQLDGKGSDLATNEIEEVVKAAKYGKVDTLFVPLNVQYWGRFEPESNQVISDGKPSLDNEDLLNFAAAQTILNAGQVYTLELEDMPGSGNLAAILRYSN